MKKRIKYFVSDIDGVLTDGKIFYINKNINRVFNIKDGIAFKFLKFANIKSVLISGKKSEETKQRFIELGLDFYFEGIENKIKVMEEFILQHKISWEEICYLGDDLPDILVMKKSGLSIAPADAVNEVKKISHYICKQKGGEGAFREAVELILKEQGQWENILKNFYSY